MDAEIQDAVDQPLIQEIFITGEPEAVSAATYLACDRRGFAQLRLEVEDAILRGEPTIRCAACHHPVKPRLSIHRRPFFRHAEGDRDCPYQTSGGKSQRLIDAMRYNGRKESEDHKRIKSYLAVSLQHDDTFSDLAEEQRWWGVADEKAWRKPDVSAKHGGLRIAFEVQLSTTFLNVMTERRRFYLENDGLLIWIFKDVQTVDPHQFQDDIFYNNNSNIFVVDSEVAELSCRERQLYLRCYYLEPTVRGVSVHDEWRSVVVPFAALTIEKETQQIYYFDCAAARSTTSMQAQTAEDDRLRENFCRYWRGLTTNSRKDNEWNGLREEFGKRGIALPDRPDRDLTRFACLTLSVYHGEAVGLKYANFLQVANYAYDNCKDMLWYFADLLRRTGHWRQIEDLDRLSANRKRKTNKPHHAWDKKWLEVQDAYRAKNPKVPQNRTYDSLYDFLFPPS